MMVLLPGCMCCSPHCSGPFPDSVEVRITQPLTDSYAAYLLHRQRGWNGPYEPYDITDEWDVRSSITATTGTYSLSRTQGTNVYSFTQSNLSISVTLWQASGTSVVNSVTVIFRAPTLITKVVGSIGSSGERAQSTDISLALSTALTCLSNGEARYSHSFSISGCNWLAYIGPSGCIFPTDMLRSANGWTGFNPQSTLDASCRLPQTTQLNVVTKIRAGNDNVSTQPPSPQFANKLSVASSSFPINAIMSLSTTTSTSDFAFGINVNPSIDAVALIYDGASIDFFKSYGASACQ